MVPHNIAVSMFPTWVGKALRRGFRTDGDELVLKLVRPTLLWSDQRHGAADLETCLTES